MKEHPGFGEAEAKRIIDRAAELDAQRGQPLNVAALRDIATEAGISPAAVDQALQEHGRQAPALKTRFLQRRGLLVAGAIVALLLLYAVARMVLVLPQG